MDSTAKTCAVLFKDGTVGHVRIPQDKLGQPFHTYRMVDVYDEQLFAGINPSASMEMKTFLPVKVFTRHAKTHTTWTVFLEQ
jgi:hypothetical protein